MRKKLFWSLALAASLPALSGGCASTTKPAGAQPTLMDKLTTNIKGASASVAAAVKPDRSPEPASSPAPGAKAGPNVFVAMAQVNERSGNFDEAESQYQKALHLDPKHLGALLGYARMEDGRHNFEAAMKLYQTALKKHSRDAAVHNDMALCYHRHNMLNEAAKALRRAVELSPDRKLYRDNLAAVYVDQGKTKEALVQLTAAHGEAVGNYNLGYLLAKKQEDAEALVHFRKAAEKDPSLVVAQQWIARLSSPPAESDSQTKVAIANASREPIATSQRTSVTFTIDPAAKQGRPSEFVLRTNGASTSTAAGAQSVDSPAEKPGVQLPKARGSSNNPSDAVPPMPPQSGERTSGDNRLPSVTRSNG